VKILILHNTVSDNPSADEADVLVQAEAIERSLLELGHTVERLGCDHDLAALVTELKRRAPDLVFNLVEALLGTGRLLNVVPTFLDALGLRYTGGRAEALYLSTNKLLAKDKLDAAGLPTPPWRSSRASKSDEPFQPGRYIVKSVWEHASIGLDDSSVATYRREKDLEEAIRSQAQRLGGDSFGELYIEGRELNIGVLDGPDGPFILPPAEIVFTDYPADKPKIVGYASKWTEASFEYQNTIRTFDIKDVGSPEIREAIGLTRAVWDLFDLSGYARVDFRLASDGTPYILEVNANPCLSPDAGYAAGLEAAGVRYTEAIARIMAVALSLR
jgi:D-alanine-D-alanine ligase